MRYYSHFELIAVLLVALAAAPARGAVSGLQLVASGLPEPIFATHAPGDRTRLFVVQRGGAIRMLDLTTGTVEPTPFLTIPGVDVEGEGGLLGMAFHPNYATNGQFYVNVTIDNDGQVFQDAVSPFSTEIRQYQVSSNPNIADPTPTPILSFIQPQVNHNAGWIGFSPDNGYLYIPTGDGGAANDLDPDLNDTDGNVGGHTQGIGNAQDITDNLLGKILRIDVNSDDFPEDANRNYHIPADNPYAGATTGDDEIWAIGLRNPFRNSFDRLTGDLWLADVGQFSREEITRQPVDAPAGENFGWRLREGNVETPTPGIGGPVPANYRAPVYDYDHDADDFGGIAVSGGYIYRGPDPSLQGKYFFLDSVLANFWILDPADAFGTVDNINAELTPNAGSPSFPVSFGEDAVGNLYVTYLNSGDVYRIATSQLLAGDFDADGDVDNADYTKWRAALGSANPNPASDGNANAVFDAADYVVWRKNNGASVHASAGPGSNAAVPEPMTILQAAFGMLAFLFISTTRLLGASFAAGLRRWWHGERERSMICAVLEALGLCRQYLSFSIPARLAPRFPASTAWPAV
jgi:glucose/arabinose dehydrogenase